MDPVKALCFLRQDDRNSEFKRRCIASAISVDGKYFLLTLSHAIKDEDKQKKLILKRYSRRHFGRYTVEVLFFGEFGEFTLLEIKDTPKDNGKKWAILSLNLKLPSSESQRVLTSPCALEDFKFKFTCDGNGRKIELISKKRIEETSILGAPIITEENGRFFVIGVLGWTSERKLYPCFFNENILGEFSLVCTRMHLAGLNSVSCNGECNYSSSSKYEPEKSTLLHVLISLIFGQLLRDTISNCAVLSLSRMYFLHVAHISIFIIRRSYILKTRIIGAYISEFVLQNCIG